MKRAHAPYRTTDALQIALGLLAVILLALWGATLAGWKFKAGWYEDLAGFVTPALFFGMVTVIVIMAVRLKGLIARAERRWQDATGLAPAATAGALGSDLGISPTHGWTDNRVSNIYEGTMRGRRVVVFRLQTSHSTAKTASALSSKAFAVAEIAGPLPLVEITRSSAGGASQSAFGQLASPGQTRPTDTGLTITPADAVHAEALLTPPVVAAIKGFPFPFVGVATEGARVIAWSLGLNSPAMRDVLLKLACDVADAIPQGLLNDFRTDK